VGEAVTGEDRDGRIDQPALQLVAAGDLVARARLRHARRVPHDHWPNSLSMCFD
jgi:hypothetical protein